MKTAFCCGDQGDRNAGRQAGNHLSHMLFGQDRPSNTIPAGRPMNVSRHWLLIFSLVCELHCLRVLLIPPLNELQIVIRNAIAT